MRSTPQVRTDLFGRKLDKVLLTDFFGSVRTIQLLNQTSASSEGEGQEGVVYEETRPQGEGLPSGHYLTAQDSLVSDTCRGRESTIVSPILFFIESFLLKVPRKVSNTVNYTIIAEN